jgi:hypothetical protein
LRATRERAGHGGLIVAQREKPQKEMLTANRRARAPKGSNDSGLKKAVRLA